MKILNVFWALISDDNDISALSASSGTTDGQSTMACLSASVAYAKDNIIVIGQQVTSDKINIGRHTSSSFPTILNASALA